MNREDEIITDELIAQIDEEIDRLPRHQRNPTKLAIKDQLTPDAISLVTGVESRLVKQYIHKGKKRIYKQINGDRVKA
jgi:DNA-directed RNA polymerase specialized sigma24 family protein